MAKKGVDGYDTITTIKHKNSANRNTLQPMSASTVKWEDLSLNSNLNSAQLEQIASQLDLVTIALLALTQIGAVGIRQAAQELKLESIVTKWVNGSPSDRHEQLNVGEVKSLVLIISHLAQQHQILMRQNITDWEQTIQDCRSVQESSLADYISNFIKIYQDRTHNVRNLSTAVLSEAALNILVQLLLYSSPNGHQRLWGALLHRAGTQPS